MIVQPGGAISRSRSGDRSYTVTSNAYARREDKFWIVRLKRAATALAIVLILGVSGIGWFGLSAPALSHAPLADGLIDATSVEGRALFATSLQVDYGQLSPYLVGQTRRAYCGVATGAVVVNALRHPSTPLTQATFFTPQVAAVRSALRIAFGGLTLDQLAELLRAQGLDVIVVYAAQTDLAAFRSAALEVLAEPAQFLIANYDRVVLHQQGAGHISPVGAYDSGSDRFLVLDVAAHKYPPTWVRAVDLWNAMNTVDSASGATRGYLLVREGSPNKNIERI